MGNKYYWLKLKRDFFKRHDIRIIEEMPNGKDYILFYLKMLLESIDHDGELRFSDSIPYNEQMLSIITNTNIDIVKAAMKMFIELDMLEVYDDKTIFMSEVQMLMGSETTSAERVRKHREFSLNKATALQCNTDVTKCNTEIEIEKELDIELDTVVVPQTRSKRFTPPSVDDVKAYCQERNNGIDASHFVDYYTANDWKVGKNKMKDWQAAVRTWEKNGFNRTEPNKRPDYTDPSIYAGIKESDDFV